MSNRCSGPVWTRETPATTARAAPPRRVPPPVPSRRAAPAGRCGRGLPSPDCVREARAVLQQIPCEFAESDSENRACCEHGPRFLEQIDPDLHAKLSLIGPDSLYPALAQGLRLRTAQGKPRGVRDDEVQTCKHDHHEQPETREGFESLAIAQPECPAD